jgi:hypothetical protein
VSRLAEQHPEGRLTALFLGLDAAAPAMILIVTGAVSK